MTLEKIIPPIGLIMFGIVISILFFGKSNPPPDRINPEDPTTMRDLSEPTLSYFQAEDALNTIQYYKQVKIVQVFRLKDGKFLCDCDTETDSHKRYMTKYEWQVPRPGEWWTLGLGYDGSVVLDGRIRNED